LLLGPAEARDAAQLNIDDDLRALALLNLGIAEIYGAARVDDAERHLEQCIALARRIRRPYLEAHALGHAASIASFRSFSLAMERGLRAIDLARQHGWSDDPALLNAYVSVALTTLWRGEVDEAEPWLRHAESVVRPELDPALGLVVHVARAELEFARGRYAEAAAALRTAEQLPGLLAAPRAIADHARGFLLQTLLKVGDTKSVKATLAQLDETALASGETRIVRALLKLAERDPAGASVALAPVLGGVEALFHPNWQVVAYLLEAIARSAQGETAEADRALERALDLAEPSGALLAFIFYPAPELLERHRRSRTAHGALISQIQDRLAVRRGAPESAGPARLRESLTASETRVLRYLPTNLTLKEIADELHLSANTVKTHVQQLYDKLDAHSRSNAVKRARELALLAPEIRRG
jgi:LuxR family maltose regulon positive regulatory protein